MISSSRRVAAPTPTSLHTFTEEEDMLREAGQYWRAFVMLQCRRLTTSPVRRFAKEEVEPRVREMDENESMDPKVIQGLFEQGVSEFIRVHFPSHLPIPS